MEKKDLKKSEKILLGVTAAMLLLVFWPILPGLFQAWLTDPESSHGLLIPLVSGYFLWQKRAVVLSQPWSSSRLGLFVLIAGLFLYIVSHWGGIELGERLGFVTTLFGAVLYNLGRSAFRAIVFPMAFLYLMIPIPVSLYDLLAFPMQLFATRMSKELLLWSGVPVVQAGNILHFPQGSLEVVAACSGIRSLVSYFTLALFFSYITPGRRLAKIILLLSTIPIALLANILRISGSGLLGFVYGMHLAKGFLHDFSGFLLFFFGLVVFVIEARYLRRTFPEKVS